MSRLCRLKTASHGDDGKWAHGEIVSLRKQRDELMTALKKLTEVFANIGITSGLYDDEQDALKSACAAIASVKGQK